MNRRLFDPEDPIEAKRLKQIDDLRKNREIDLNG